MTLAVVKPAKGKSPPEPRDTHESYAVEFLEETAVRSGNWPVFAEGELWLSDGPVWKPLHPRDLRNLIARKFDGRKLAATQRQIEGVAARICDRAHDSLYFAGAPLGVATPSQFWRLERGQLIRDERTADQRQRFELPVDPEFGDNGHAAPAPDWDRFLAETFAGDHCAREIDQLQEIAGGAILGLLPAHQKAVLLYGPTRSGKGTFATILEALLPAEAVCSVAPDRWGHEYHRAALAGRRLNLVGEVDESRPIPCGDFKSVIGRDLVGARHPNHAAFTFRCEAAHVFSGNAFPGARDRDDAFYIRWIICGFPNSAAGHEDPDLAARIVRTCLPSVLAWALLGAERLAARGRFDPAPSHERLLERWRREHSSVLTWLHDGDAVTLTADAVVPRADAYAAFRDWCTAVGRRPLGSHTFYLEVRRSAGRYGVREERTSAGFVLRGIVLQRERSLFGQ